MKERHEIEDELCEFCTLEKKGIYGVPGGFVAGCEGSGCDNAYDAYVDYCQDNEKIKDGDTTVLEQKLNELKNEQCK